MKLAKLFSVVVLTVFLASCSDVDQNLTEPQGEVSSQIEQMDINSEKMTLEDPKWMEHHDEDLEKYPVVEELYAPRSKGDRSISSTGDVTLDFNTYGHPANYYEDDFKVSIYSHMHLHGQYFEFHSWPATISKVDGGTFSLKSLDVIYTGRNLTLTSSSGASVTLTPGSYTFPASGWSGVTWIKFSTSGSASLDNIVLGVNSPPDVSLDMQESLLWPPNHKMRLVATGSATDAEDAGSDLTLNYSVTSNEDINGTGDGNTEPDWEFVDNGDGSFEFYVRAERDGGGSGRVYNLSVSASDTGGLSSSTLTGEVTVPHDKGKKK